MKRKKLTRHLSVREVLFFHSAAIQEFGGLHGVRDLHALHAALERPKQTFDGRDLYPDVFFKAAALFHSLALNHPFVDGNKRTAITAAAIFLRHNGFFLQAKRNSLYRYVLHIVKQKPEITAIAEWLRKNCVSVAG